MDNAFINIIKKYFKKNKRYLFSKNVVHEMNGVVLNGTCHAAFDFYGIMIDDVIDYCKRQGYCPDKIIFLSSYDIELEGGSKLTMQMRADSKISIIEEDGMIIARVCVGESVSIRNKHGYS